MVKIIIQVLAGFYIADIQSHDFSYQFLNSLPPLEFIQRGFVDGTFEVLGKQRIGIRLPQPHS